jgi:hypothetical protein
MFNTLSYARRLESVGMSRDQAEAHVQIIAEIVGGDLATKQDMRELRSDLDHKFESMENRLLIKLCALTSGLVTLAVAIIAVLIRSH